VVVCVLVPLRMDGDSLWQSNKYTFRKYHIDHMKGEKYAENFSEFLKLKEEKRLFTVLALSALSAAVA